MYKENEEDRIKKLKDCIFQKEEVVSERIVVLQEFDKRCHKRRLRRLGYLKKAKLGWFGRMGIYLVEKISKKINEAVSECLWLC